jgi:ABC-2 type transport system permease protein
VTALAKLTAVQFKLFVREKILLFFTFAFPLLLLAGFGTIKGFREASPDLGGQTGIELIASIAIAMVVAMLGMSALPSSLTSDREQGVLRRLAASPVHPAMLLLAQVAVGLLAAVVMVVLVVGLGRFAYGIPEPERLGAFVAVLALAAAALFGVGLLVAALAPSARGAQLIGFILFYPSLFLAGVWFPREALPPALQRVSDFTPLGAALQGVRDTWTGHSPRPLHLAIMAAWAVLAGTAAARFFRWE